MVFDNQPTKRKSKKEVKSFEDGYNAALYDLLNAHQRMSLSITIFRTEENDGGWCGLRLLDEYECINRDIRKNTVDSYKFNKTVIHEGREELDSYMIKMNRLNKHLDNKKRERKLNHNHVQEK